jgi:hypothetical protein
VKDLTVWPAPATSDSEGRFTLRGMAENLNVVLEILDPRYASEMVDFQTDGGENPKRLTVSLKPARIVTGRVTFSDTGQPASHMRVGIAPPFIPLVETDAEGRYRLNASSAERPFFSVRPPVGQPYLGVSKRFDWTPGESVHTLDVPLPRGVLLRGKVIEEGSGQPVAGAGIVFRAGSISLTADRERWSATASGPDGTFHFGVLPGPGHLVVHGSSHEYVLREVGQQLSGGKTLQREYAHACVFVDPQRGNGSPDIEVKLRRGVTAEGRVIDPEGNPVESASMISVNIRLTLSSPARWNGSYHGSVRRGRFKLFGIGSNGDTPVYFLEAERKLGATVHPAGKSAAGGPLTVRLEPCGQARVRFVDKEGKPIPECRNSAISMVVTPGISPYSPRTQENQDQPPSEEGFLTQIDPTNYRPINRATGRIRSVISDTEGRAEFPVLIPDATYRIYEDAVRLGGGFQLRKEFVARAGEILDLGDILIERPQK